MKKALKIIGIGLLSIVILMAVLFGYWFFRPNKSVVSESLKMELSFAVSDGMHNSNTDMIVFQDEFYLIHASSPFHFASTDCKLILHKSKDAREWETIHTFSIPDQDIRDPKFAIINNTLYLYVLKNIDFEAEPYTTAFTKSQDGKNWADLKDINLEGWLFWRPKTNDGINFYCPAYWYEHGKSVLLKSTNGERWSEVSIIYEGDRNDETAIHFMNDGRLIYTARLEVSDSWTGDEDACTLIGTSSYPYKEWTHHKNYVTRLDGPALFDYKGEIFAVGRHNPDSPGFLNDFGSILGTKRTSLYLVLEDDLIYLSDLPSAGDTSYSGVVIRDQDAYICYYTSNIDRDYPWIIGMVMSSDIMLAKISLNSLFDLAMEKLE